jgi:hypothetical protein
MVGRRLKDYYLGVLVGLLACLSFFLATPGWVLLTVVILVINILFSRSLGQTEREEKLNARN